MRLQVLLPHRRLVDEQVQKVSAESGMGSFTLLPRHIDLVTTIEPGLLAYTIVDGEEIHLAIDEGILVKRAADVLVSVNRAVRGEDLHTLRQAVQDEFRKLDEREREARAALAGLETDLVRYFVELGE
ncbi:MAG: F0F1 ATP synthase subunit epsilon [Chloroflexi bacterium]|nr:F0F1 ATP synthase subunit epsilon [Chloroflexota bacterium]